MIVAVVRCLCMFTSMILLVGVSSVEGSIVVVAAGSSVESVDANEGSCSASSLWAFKLPRELWGVGRCCKMVDAMASDSA